MPVENLYATAEELAARVPSFYDAGEGALDETKRDAAEELLEAISRAIDSKTKREPGAFSPSPAEPTERTFYGNGESCLPIPDHVAGSIPEEEGVTTIAGLTAPHFTVYRAMLCATDERGVLSREVWLDGVPYKVKARWGYAATPADIREACLVWASLRARLNAGDVSGVVTTITRDGATMQRDDIPPTVKDLLLPYVLPETEDRDKGVEFGNLRDADVNPWSW